MKAFYWWLAAVAFGMFLAGLTQVNTFLALLAGIAGPAVGFVFGAAAAEAERRRLEEK